MREVITKNKMSFVVNSSNWCHSKPQRWKRKISKLILGISSTYIGEDGKLKQCLQTINTTFIPLLVHLGSLFFPISVFSCQASLSLRVFQLDSFVDQIRRSGDHREDFVMAQKNNFLRREARGTAGLPHANLKS